MTELTRRAFLSELLAASAVPTLCAGESDCRLTLGVLSDIHLRRDATMLTRALSRFAADFCDGVVIAGDLADAGFLSQLMLLSATWRRIFPGGRNPFDGRPVERLFVYGNHDSVGSSYGYAASLRQKGVDIEPDILAKMGMDVGWRKAFDEDFAPIWRKEVRGIRFYGAHWLEGGASVRGLAEFLEREKKTIDPSKPFFYVQHAHPKGTCYGAAAWGADNGVSTKALSAFPNALAISGHSHLPLTDERSVWQGAFTSLGAGSLFFTGRGYRGKDTSFTVPKPDEPGGFLTRDGNQGMILRVYDDHLDVNRLDFRRGRDLGAPWIVPLPARADSPFGFAVRTSRSEPPAFAADARVAVRRQDGFLVLTVPPATAGRTRVFSYTVEVAGTEDGAKPRVDRFLSRTFHLPDGEDRLVTECPIRLASLPQGPWRVKVYPVNCLGARGEGLQFELKGDANESA